MTPRTFTDMTPAEQSDIRAKALPILNKGLTRIRHGAGFRQKGFVLHDDARFEIARLADALHNIPAWLLGETYFDGSIASDIATAEEAIANLRARFPGSTLIPVRHVDTGGSRRPGTPTPSGRTLFRRLLNR